MDYDKLQNLRKRKETILQGLIETSKLTRSLEQELKEINETLSQVYIVMGDFDKSLSPIEYELYVKHFIEGKNLRVCAEEIPMNYGYARLLKVKIKGKINNLIKEQAKK